MGVEPMNTGFADQRVSHFATGALLSNVSAAMKKPTRQLALGGRR